MDGAPTLAVERRPGATVALGLWIRAGSAHEPEELAGATHLLEHLLLKRTRRHGPEAMAALIDGLGGAVDAYTTRETCALTAHVPAERFDEALELLCEALFAPRLVASEVDTERRVVAAELDMVQDSPAETVAERALRACWGSHPLARPVLGTRGVVERVGVRELQGFHRRRFTADRLLVVIVGPVDEDRVAARLQRLPALGDALPRLQPPQWRGGVEIESRPGLEQAYVNLVLPGLPVSHPDAMVLAVLHQLLGGGNASRLFRELRERRGLVYDVGSTVFSSSLAGVLEVVFSAPIRNLAGCWDAVIATLEAVSRGGVEDGEVELARRALQAGLVLSTEGCDALLEAHAGELLGRGRRFDLGSLQAEVGAVTTARVRALAKELVRVERIAGAVCGPEDEIVLPSWLSGRAA